MCVENAELSFSFRTAPAKFDRGDGRDRECDMGTKIRGQSNHQSPMYDITELLRKLIAHGKCDFCSKNRTLSIKRFPQFRLSIHNLVQSLHAPAVNHRDSLLTRGRQ